MLCIEPLRDARHGAHKIEFSDKGKAKGMARYTEWRELDHWSIDDHRKQMLQWISDYNTRICTRIPRSGYPKVRVINESYFGNQGLDEELEAACKLAGGYVGVMSQETGAWQPPWPQLSEPVLALMRTHEWGDRLWYWPTEETLTGHGKRDLSRIMELLMVLEDSMREDSTCEDNEENPHFCTRNMGSLARIHEDGFL